MIFTNKHELPDAFYRAVANDPYTKGESDFSATGLQQPPRATVLLEQHKDVIEIDISSRVAVIIGQGVHSILERAARPGIDIIEKRFYGNFFIDGKIYIVSAQIDLFESDTGFLQDWKTAKSFAFHKANQGKAEWEAQLNIGALLLEWSGESVKGLRIIGLLKDWDKKKAKSEPGYPPTEVMCLEVPRWSEEKTTGYIQSRVLAIIQARQELPLCTPSETWRGNRCGNWCDASSVCDQWKKTKQTGLLDWRMK